MFGRICVLATFLPTILCAQESLGLHPYARADIGMARYLDVDMESDAPEALKSIEDDLKNAFEFSFAAGLTGPQKSIGLGLVFQRDASEGKTSSGSTIEIDGGSISNISTSLKSTLVGAQAIFLHELSAKVMLRGEVGLAKAMTEQTLDMDMTVSTTTQGDVLAETKTTIEGDGVAFLAGCGLDVFLTPKIALGAMLNFVSGSATPNSMDITVNTLGQTRKQSTSGDELDTMEDQDISSLGITGGVRFLF